MGKGSPQPWTQNRGGWVGTGKVTGKQRANTGMNVFLGLFLKDK